MPCSKRGHSGDLEYKQIIASPAGKVNRYSPTKIALGKKSCDRIFGLFPGFGRVRGTGRSPSVGAHGAPTDPRRPFGGGGDAPSARGLRPNLPLVLNFACFDDFIQYQYQTRKDR